jgi:hypothetical protein
MHFDAPLKGCIRAATLAVHRFDHAPPDSGRG